jgi:hypothetical protein
MRDDILDFVKRELIGPDPIKPHVQENGEEILLNEPPRMRYGAGILFPKTSSFTQLEASDNYESEILNSEEEEEPDDSDESDLNQDSKTPADSSEDFEEEIGLANNYLPAAIGFSCFTKMPKKGFLVDVNAAIYRSNDYSYERKDGTSATRKAYYRIPLDQEFLINENQLPKEPGSSKDFSLYGPSSEELKLKLNVRNRTHGSDINTGIHLLTFTLINHHESTGENINNEECFFQTSFSIRTEDKEKCFYPYKSSSSKADKEDEKSNNLLIVLLVNQANTSQGFRVTMLGLIACQPDDLITLQPGREVDRRGRFSIILQILSGPDDKATALAVQVMQPLEVQVSPVHNVDASCENRDHIQDVHIMHFAIGNMDKSGDSALQVHHCVKFNGSFVFPELCPLEQRQAQVDGRGVQDSNRFGHFIFAIQFLCMSDQYHSQFLIYFPWSRSIGIRECTQ